MRTTPGRGGSRHRPNAGRLDRQGAEIAALRAKYDDLDDQRRVEARGVDRLRAALENEPHSLSATVADDAPPSDCWKASIAREALEKP